MIAFAHVSDTHVDDSVRSVARTARVFEYLNSLPGSLDAVVVTGDLTNNGLPGEYEQFAKLTAGPRPVLHLPGNHDVRESYQQVLLGGGPINRVERVGGAVFALVDSTIPGRADGFIADDTLSWLETVLTEAGDAPAFVCFHHPPVTLNVPYIDGMRQQGEDRLASLLSRHPGVVAVLCGHAHSGAATTFAGRPLLVAPGVVSTLALPWEADETVIPALPPAVAFHVLTDDRRLITHYRVVTSV